MLLPTADSCRSCLGNFQINHPRDSESFGGGQYYNMYGIVKYPDCPIITDADYRCFNPVTDIGLVEYLDQDFARYVSSSPWHRRHKEEIDVAILDYCSGIMWSVIVVI